MTIYDVAYAGLQFSISRQEDDLADALARFYRRILLTYIDDSRRVSQSILNTPKKYSCKLTGRAGFSLTRLAEELDPSLIHEGIQNTYSQPE